MRHNNKAKMQISAMIRWMDIKEGKCEINSKSPSYICVCDINEIQTSWARCALENQTSLIQALVSHSTCFIRVFDHIFVKRLSVF